MADTIRHRGCTITKSTQCLANTGQPLYGIDGQFNKPAAVRPFIVSVREARAWIDASSLSEVMGRTDVSAL